MSFSIELAQLDQVADLCAIERKAVQLFRGHEAWATYLAMPLPADLLERAIVRGRVWVAREGQGMPVGFVWLGDERSGDAIDLVEIDVLPAHGQRGIGGALLNHACAWARAAGYRRVDLGTLADLPWNAPFYEKHGFSRIVKGDPRLEPLLERDHANGFPDGLRVFMRRDLAPLEPTDWSWWPAPAKLNLFLRITSRRPDGYHELQTVFRLLDWGDGIHLRVRDDGAIRRLNDVPGVPASADLVVRAALLLQSHGGTPLGAEIRVDKRIPMGGGLGGGSSDAASVLVGLNLLWRLDLAADVLAELGRQLGADVPVFVRGRTAWAEGIGEQLTPMPLPRRHYVVVDPHEAVPTAALFQAAELTRNAPRATISSFASGETTENVFAPVVRARHPRVAAALDWLAGFGEARLSGSGGCVFLETRSWDRASAIVAQCPATFTAWPVTGVDASPLQDALARHCGI